MRGVAPAILISHVRNTAPFFYETPADWLARAPHLKPLFDSFAADTELDDVTYYRLCVAAHHGTVATFVPTDVDNQIRQRLWQTRLSDDSLRGMVDVVLESRSWDCRAVTARLVVCPETGFVLSGHNGEWFSCAAGAWAATRNRAPELAARVAGEIQDEVTREGALFRVLASRGDGLGMLRAAALIAHNLGDLQRVLEMWGRGEDAATDFGRASNTALAAACELNKSKMAAENHRNFALRKPRALRRSIDLLLPLGPFFDDWGALLARHPALTPADLGEIAEALLEGLARTPGSIGYTRALAGLESQMRGGAKALQDLVPASKARELKSGELRRLISVSRERFEAQWASAALQFRSKALH
jgi:hypothetical protein